MPAISTIERLCADTLVAAERRIETRIANRLNHDERAGLDDLLSEMVEDRLTRFVWLRKFEVGSSSAGARRMLDRLAQLHHIMLSPDEFHGVPDDRITRLRRQGERCFADGLRELPDDRRHAILAVCVSEWRSAIADAVVETHDRIVGKTWREAARLCDARMDGAQPAVQETLRSFRDMGTALLEAKRDHASRDDAVSSSPGWADLHALVAVAARLTDTLSSDPISHVVQGYKRFRRYVLRMLRLLEIDGADVAKPLLEVAELIRSNRAHGQPTHFPQGSSKWQRHMRNHPAGDRSL